MGRPRLGAQAKRIGLSLRVTPELHDRLEAVAQTTGRSVAMEVESRIERLFFDEDVRSLGRAGRAFLEVVAGGTAAIQLTTGRTLDEDFVTWDAVRAHIEWCLGELMPDRSEVAAVSEARMDRVREASVPMEAAALMLRRAVGAPNSESIEAILVGLAGIETADLSPTDIAFEAAKLGLEPDPLGFDMSKLVGQPERIRKAVHAYLEARAAYEAEFNKAIAAPENLDLYDRYRRATEASFVSLQALRRRIGRA